MKDVGLAVAEVGEVLPLRSQADVDWNARSFETTLVRVVQRGSANLYSGLRSVRERSLERQS
jgi:hypothetical protein